MKVKFTLDRNTSTSRKSDAVSKIASELRNKPTVSGDVITVDSYDERKVTDILSRVGINYARGRA